MSTAFAPVGNAKTVLLTTYKRDGAAVGTPVSIAFDGDRAFFRSYDKAWKTKRLRRDPRVRVAPATLRGKPTGRPSRLARRCWRESRRGSPRGPWRDVTGYCKRFSSLRLTALCTTAPCTMSFALIPGKA